MQLHEMLQEVMPSRTEKTLNLLYLQKAVREENYELCTMLVDRARGCGASSKEIGLVLRHPRWHMESF